MTTQCRRRIVALSLFSGLFALMSLATCSLTNGGSFGSAGPLAAYALPAGERVLFDGHVVERLDAGSYVYLAVDKSPTERVWVVTLASSKGAAPGVANVHVVAMGHATHFDSKRLGRSFDDLYFAVVRST